MGLRTSLAFFWGATVLAGGTAFPHKALAQERVQVVQAKPKEPRTLQGNSIKDFIDKNREYLGTVTCAAILLVIFGAAITAKRNSNDELSQEAQESLYLMQEHALRYLEENLPPPKFAIVEKLKKDLETQLEENGLEAMLKEYKKFLETNLTFEQLQELNAYTDRHIC